jgi:hypothetical protein
LPCLQVTARFGRHCADCISWLQHHQARRDGCIATAALHHCNVGAAAVFRIFAGESFNHPHNFPRI